MSRFNTHPSRSPSPRGRSHQSWLI